MYYIPVIQPYPYAVYAPRCCDGRSVYWMNPNISKHVNAGQNLHLTDYGPKPFVMNINKATKQNNTFRTALWTGAHLQVTVMSLDIGEDIGLEMHSNLDQFLRIEQGRGIVKMGKSKDQVNFQRNVYDDSAIVIPAGTWHNLINTGNTPLKLYSIYAPPNHPFGTVHVTKADAEAAEKEHSSYKI
ncbi:hypothetical protein CPT06_17065 [Bacillus vallismortis]|uniref:cupin domain-containing protein n=1 Tax=Bacillus vallismortis TaxID=72361 RepID=UPI000C2975E9|nr:cupin domain-containing protein [Bacillus vallismortis]PJY99140.1 hypothetical protein CPT06_17065 [Bacillus vallismortis]